MIVVSNLCLVRKVVGRGEWFPCGSKQMASVEISPSPLGIFDETPEGR
jgi:hypothetical protein